MELDRDDRRILAWLDARDKYGLDHLKRWWDFEVCSKEAAQKVLEHAGCDFQKIWALNARKAHNPYTGRDVLTIDWKTVAYYLNKKGVICYSNVIDGVDKAKEYYNNINN